ncbi:MULTISPECIES: hypothetical protein [Bradyrhizobium]|uniref:Uncharacterized protein n=1 Tax=Bradyrhizobium brasilense TaxID=1419277 RepID=A0ABY8JMG6_9BRAD|nr:MULTISPECIES: hypothetical protein [Bradyrhizobium]WFU66862.1 hypothetical protein QA636_15790 [Bradyrhizobium brasilense]
MAYFTTSVLDEVRDDPSSVVDLYGTTGAAFIAALDMPGLTADAYMAAFCTVLAYDLVPYGDEPAGVFDVETLANAPSLACDRYVTLAWELVSLLGVPDGYGTAVGWDGGAVGNHAQWLYDDGQTQLLLDPTIGLIVNDATFDGLINGVHYTDIASFYSRDDITLFNTQVISAVERGSYEVWDTIYYVPGLTEWQTNYFAHVGVTVDLGNDAQIITGYVGDDTIDAGAGDDWVFGGKGSDDLDGDTGIDHAVYRGDRLDYSISFGGAGSATIAGADGTDVLHNFEMLQFDDQQVALPVDRSVQTDSADNFAWNTIVTDTDYQGKQLSVSYHNDDGSSWVYQYDTLDQFTWDRIQIISDTQSNVIKQLYDQNDGSHVSYQYDPNDTAAWSRITSYLTSDYSKQTKAIYDQDDGSHVMYTYDVNNTGAWKSVESYFTADWQAIKHLYNEDDGSHVLYQYDVNNAYSWDMLQTNYDSTFHRTRDILTNDSGTHSILVYDQGGTQLMSVANYDAGWNLMA